MMETLKINYKTNEGVRTYSFEIAKIEAPMATKFNEELSEATANFDVEEIHIDFTGVEFFAPEACVVLRRLGELAQQIQIPFFLVNVSKELGESLTKAKVKRHYQ